MIDLTAIEAELTPLSNDDLKAKFKESYLGAARFLAIGAVSYKILTDRGVDLEGVPLVGFFRRIAGGQLLPEFAWMFMESPNRQALQFLPIQDQQRLIKSPMVPVVEVSEKGHTTRMVDLTKAPKEVVNLAVSPDGIRSPDEQRQYLGALKARPAPPKVGDDELPDGPLTHTIKIRLTDSELETIKIYAARNRIEEREAIRRVFVRGLEKLKI